MSWEPEVDEIRKRRELARAQGGAEGIDRQHSYGKLTIRERIERVLEPGSFREHGQMTGSAFLDEDGEVESFTPANYVIALGKIDGRRVAVGGEDLRIILPARSNSNSVTWPRGSVVATSRSALS